MDDIKQVIVIRKDLKMRRGKEQAQAAHASMAFITKRLQRLTGDWFQLEMSGVEQGWLKGSYKKISLQVDSEEALLEIYRRALGAGLEVHLVTDSGLTEFDGIYTKTCLAIGPDLEEKIDPITRHLALY